MDKIQNIGGCTARATQKISKTARNSQSNTHALTAKVYSCLGGSVKSSSQQLGGNNKSSSNSNISYNSQRSACSTLLLIAMTLATLAPQQHIAAAYKLPASYKETEIVDDTSLALPSVEVFNYQHHGNNNMRRTRLRKRHSNHLYFDHHLHESAHELEWQNPCGGSYEPMPLGEDAGLYSALPMRVYLKPLRLSTRHEYRTLNETLHAIDISDIEVWRLHKSNYKFLPNLKRNSSIALKRWYRNMQTYVGAFAYLGRTQYKWDHAKLMHASQTTKELNELLLSARRLLCEIETAINGSYPHDSHNKLTAISRVAMNRRLRFRTKRHQEQDMPEADKIDMKFTKYAYYDFLSNMWKVLRKNAKRRGQIALHQHQKAHEPEHSEQLSEENVSISLRPISGLSGSSSASASESFEIIENRSISSSDNSRRRHENQSFSKHRGHNKHGQSAQLNEV